MTITPENPIWGIPTVHKFGSVFDVDTGTVPEDVWSGDGVYTGFVAAAGTTTLVSSSAADAAAGTGAQTVTVFGLDANYLSISETVTTNGITPVNFTNDYLRVFRAFVATAGSGEVNAGNITVSIGAAVAAHIATGYGQTLQACYTIPADYDYAQLVHWYATNNGTNTATYAQVALQSRSFGSAWQTKELVTVTEAANWQYEFAIPVGFNPRTDMRIRVIAVGANNTSIAAGFDMILGGG